MTFIQLNIGEMYPEWMIGVPEEFGCGSLGQRYRAGRSSLLYGVKSLSSEILAEKPAGHHSSCSSNCLCVT